MSDASHSPDVQCRQRSSHAVASDAVAPDNGEISLTLRPAEFDDEHHDTPATDVSLTGRRDGSSRQSPSHNVANSVRSSIKRRELVELAGNPFVDDPHGSRADGRPSFRQDIYPAYDASGRRIGLEHVRNATVPSEAKGYYRKHVHEYDNARGAPLPFPAQGPQVHVQSNYPEQGPLPPVSAVIAGIPPDSQYGVGSFSHIQNQPRTPHEVLGLPLGAPLNLWSLLDPETPDAKPQYNYHVLVKLAILGNKGQKATLQDILRAIRMRFPYYEKLPKQEAIAFGNSIRHLLSLLAAFVREPKPVTEPGKGAYWRVDFSKGEGNKRVRKRNKPQKKSQSADKQDKQSEKDEQNNRSGSDESSQPSASSSTQASSRSPASQSPIESHPQLQTPRPRGGAKGGRKPAPKNLITTPKGGTAVIPSPPSVPYQNDFHARLDPALRNATGSASESYATSSYEPCLQLHPSGVGAYRERVARGASRSAPYPSTLAVPKNVTASVSEVGSSEQSHRYSSGQPVNMRYRNGHHSSMSLNSGNAPLPHEYQHNHQSYSVPSAYQSNVRDGSTPRHPLNSGEHHGSVSPEESPSPDRLAFSPYSEHSAHPASASSHYPSRFPHRPSSYEMSSSSTAYYGPPPLTSPSSAGSIPGPSSSVSSSSSYGFAPYAERRRPVEADTMFTTMHRTRVEHHEDENYTNSPSWNSPRSTRHSVESSRARH